jgi:hypothetical protein
VVFNPKVYNNNVIIKVIKIKGINTIIQEIIVIPPSHNKFNKNVIIIITIDLMKAVLNKPL